MCGRHDHLGDVGHCGDAAAGVVRKPRDTALLVVCRAGDIDHVVAPQRQLHSVGIRYLRACPVQMAQAAANMIERVIVTHRLGVVTCQAGINGFGVRAAAARPQRQEARLRIHCRLLRARGAARSSMLAIIQLPLSQRSAYGRTTGALPGFTAHVQFRRQETDQVQIAARTQSAKAPMTG